MAEKIDTMGDYEYVPKTGEVDLIPAEAINCP